MKISVFGLGYVGAVSVACLGRDGHDVVGVDLDPTKLQLLRNGQSPILEEGIQELTASVVAAGRVRVTSDVREAVGDTELSFVCVGTPSSSNGNQDLSAVLRLAEQLGEALRDKSDYHVVVLRSTVEPGTTEQKFLPVLEQHSGKRVGRDFGLCFQPEFLREASSIQDYDHPPFTIVGADAERSADRLRSLFGHLPCEFIRTQIGTAEAMKMVCNAFHALKITFANEVGRICQALEVDSREVMSLVCRDKSLNISPAYLKPGFAFGGSCLPKDLRALTYASKSRDVQVPMLQSLLGSNRAHIDHAISQILHSGRPRVALIGLSFKAGTDDLRESPLVTLAKRLVGEGLALAVYDPDVHLSQLLGANRRYIEAHLPHIASMVRESLKEVIDTAEVVVFGHLPKAQLPKVYELARPDQTLLDLAGTLDPGQLRCQYRGICW